MRINLGQDEITAALRLYITNTGVNLTDKTVTMLFKAGRKGKGVTVGIAIDEQGLPDLSDSTPTTDGIVVSITAVTEQPAVAPAAAKTLSLFS